MDQVIDKIMMLEEFYNPDLEMVMVLFSPTRPLKDLLREEIFRILMEHHNIKIIYIVNIVG